MVIPNAEGQRTTPSVVAFNDSGEQLVGQVAKRQAITNPTRTIFSIKRFMGRKFEEVPAEKKIVPYEVVRAANGDASVEVNGKTYAPTGNQRAHPAKDEADGRGLPGARA